MLCKRIATNEFCAIKTVHKARLVKANKIHTIFSERNVLMESRHPFIVNLIASFQTDAKVYLVLEFAGGGELFYHLQRRGPLTLDQARIYVAEVALALNYLHVRRVVYRDLKPENIMLDNSGHLKLTDFGLAKQLEEEGDMTSTFCGTPEYLAPEIVQRRPYGREVDWWALGILTYELLFRRTPFVNPNRGKIYTAIAKEEPRMPSNAPPVAVSFISMLLDKDPATRAGFQRIREHEFFEGIDFEKVLRREYEPPFQPEVAEVPCTNFDSQITAEPPIDSFGAPVSHEHDPFLGFSFRGSRRMSESSDEVKSPIVPSTFTEDE
jgi:serine/threonine protein kinase